MKLEQYNKENMYIFKAREHCSICSIIVTNGFALPTTMSAKSPGNTHIVLGIFHPRPIFAAE